MDYLKSKTNIKDVEKIKESSRDLSKHLETVNICVKN